MDKKNSDLLLMFPTPIWTSIVQNSDEINNKMYNYIKSLQSKNEKGINKSNIVNFGYFKEIHGSFKNGF